MDCMSLPNPRRATGPPRGEPLFGVGDVGARKRDDPNSRIELLDEENRLRSVHVREVVVDDEYVGSPVSRTTPSTPSLAVSAVPTTLIRGSATSSRRMLSKDHLVVVNHDNRLTGSTSRELMTGQTRMSSTGYMSMMMG